MRVLLLFALARVSCTWRLWGKDPAPPAHVSSELPRVALNGGVATEAALAAHGAVQVDPGSKKLRDALEELKKSAPENNAPLVLTGPPAGWPAAAKVAFEELMQTAKALLKDTALPFAGVEFTSELRVVFQPDAAKKTDNTCAAHADGAHVAFSATFGGSISAANGGSTTTSTSGADGSVVFAVGGPVRVASNGRYPVVAVVNNAASVTTLTLALPSTVTVAPEHRFLPQWLSEKEGIVVTPAFGQPAAASAGGLCEALDARSSFVRARLNGDGGSAKAGVGLRPCDFATLDEFIEAACLSTRERDVGRTLFDENEESSFYSPTLEEAEGSTCKPQDGARAFDLRGRRITTLDQLVQLAPGGVKGYPFLDGESVDPLVAADVWIVPSTVHWVWPTVKPGHSVNSTEGVRVTTLSMRPAVFRLERFLDPAEAKALVDKNRERVKPSEVGLVGRAGDKTRTSSNAWDMASPIARTLIERAFRVLNVDASRKLEDGLQVLHYDPPQWYKPHVDYFTQRNGGGGGLEADAFSNSVPARNNGTNRFATVFLYLSEADAGGETVFPLSKSHSTYVEGTQLVGRNTHKTPGFIRDSDATWVCNQSSSALRVVPRIADVVLFYSQRGDATLDPFSLHGSCPVVAGEKWAANLWVWNRPRDDIDKAKAKAKGSIVVTFKNTLSEQISLFWDSGSGLLPQGAVLANAEMRMNTFVDHAFVAKVGEVTLGRWAMAKGVGTIEIVKP